MNGLTVAGAALLVAGLAVLSGGDRGGRLLLAMGLPTPAAAALRDPAWRGAALYQAGRYAEAAAELRNTRSAEAAYNLGNAFARNGNLPLAVKAYDIALKRDPADADALANRALVQALLKARSEPQPADKALGTANATATAEHQAGENEVGGDDKVRSTTGDGMAGQREAGAEAGSPGSSRVDRRGAPQPGDPAAGAAQARGAAAATAGRAGRRGGQTVVAASDEPAAQSPALMAQTEDNRATLQWLAAIPDDPVRFVRLRIAAEHQRRLAAGTAVPGQGAGW
ncbi:tetratricopeptide repeat protein [Labrys wisconsinensis]|uniref:Tetratricopeptide (TPR) repeat protein n=1 Tax=Labrys wisconsinensis TaxID=425677 RepID=A0ABU0JD97_9HYPH|nr:tetratricopeptide repeat protein [Labrys wisconsinensis]MDQ0472251.1 tetratricopeptide (TPR) repeat protein [Labrys wisconsinensis]